MPLEAAKIQGSRRDMGRRNKGAVSANARTFLPDPARFEKSACAVFLFAGPMALIQL
jgi:hypothetical protein